MRPLRCLVTLLLLAACTPDYPMDKAGTWSLPTPDSNTRNLRAMIVNPNELAGGEGARDSVAVEASRPIGLLYDGKRPALPSISASTVYPVGGTGSGGTGGQ